MTYHTHMSHFCLQLQFLLALPKNMPTLTTSLQLIFFSLHQLHNPQPPPACVLASPMCQLPSIRSQRVYGWSDHHSYIELLHGGAWPAVENRDAPRRFKHRGV